MKFILLTDIFKNDILPFMVNQNSFSKRTGRPKTSIYRRLFGKSSRELARELNVSESTLTRMKNEGQLENLKITSNSDGRINKRIVKIWGNIWNRCNYPNTNKYEYYGGKGIKCLLSLEDLVYLWKRDKADFMINPSIDRIDSNGDYTIENCRFLELKENIKGRSYKKVLLFKPSEKLLSILKLFNSTELQKKLNVSCSLIPNMKNSHCIKEEKANLIVDFLNNIPDGFFKIKFEDAYKNTYYSEVREKNGRPKK